MDNGNLEVRFYESSKLTRRAAPEFFESYYSFERAPRSKWGCKHSQYIMYLGTMTNWSRTGPLHAALDRNMPESTDKPLASFLQSVIEARVAYCRAVSSEAIPVISHSYTATTNLDQHYPEQGGLKPLAGDVVELHWRRLSEAHLMISTLICTLTHSALSRKERLSEQSGPDLAEACEVKDELQGMINIVRSALEVVRGRSTLKESQKSIEMAEISIAESKRVRLLTILAFIFVPVSLTTSIFGMNIQQINQSGPSWWAVILTAVVMVVIALLGWALARRFAKVHDMLSKDPGFQEDIHQWGRQHSKLANLEVRVVIWLTKLKYHLIYTLGLRG